MLRPNFEPFPVLETKRLLLRKIVTEDAPAILALRSNPVVMQYIDRPLAASTEDALTFIKMILDAWQNNDGITWAIAAKDNPVTLIGTVGYWRFIKEHYRAELGYMLHPDHWRKGIMKEALNILIPYAFNEIKLHSIEAKINPDNIASATILTSVGFVREAFFKEDNFYKGKFMDTAVYSRLQ